MATITFNKVKIITLAKVGSVNFLRCKYYQTEDKEYRHSLINL